MFLIKFIKSLLPRLTKSQIQEDLRVTIAELDSFVIPSFEQATAVWSVSKSESKENKQLTDQFYRAFKSKYPKQSNLIAEINRRLPYLKANAEFLENEIERNLDRDVISAGLTARKANILKAAEKISFASRFSIDLLDFFYKNESVAAGDKDSKPTPYSKKQMEEGISSFARALANYGIPTKDFEKIYKSIPDVEVNGTSEETLNALFKPNELDPFADSSEGLLSQFTGNPIYHIGLVIAEWQTGRYKANKDKKKMLELRLLHLQNLQEGKNDAALQKEIEYTQGRVDRLERHLKEVEESVGA